VSALDNYTLTEAWQAPLAGNDGTVSIVNLNIGIVVTIALHHATYGSETVLLSQAGATLVLPLAGIDELTISAGSYPATILYVNTPIPMTLSTPQSFAGSSGGGATVNVEIVGLSGVTRTTAVATGASAVALPAAILANRRTITVQAPSSNTASVWVGGSAVATSGAGRGIELTPGGSASFDLGAAVLYGISAAAQVLVVMETS
jgi:hypothetical protein